MGDHSGRCNTAHLVLSFMATKIVLTKLYCFLTTNEHPSLLWTIKFSLQKKKNESKKPSTTISRTQTQQKCPLHNQF